MTIERSSYFFTADTGSSPATLDLQKAMLREKYAEGKWESPIVKGFGTQIASANGPFAAQ